MPPKKKSKGKSSKKKAKGEEDADLSLKEKLTKAEMRIETLERYLGNTCVFKCIDCR
jgi:hypothetical protein